MLAAQFLSICIALLIVMGLARWLGDRWWLPGAAVFVGIAALFTFVAPYLDYTTTPLATRRCSRPRATYETELGVGRIPIRVEEVSADTDQANAYAFGIGPSRRVVFWDTILQEPFTEDEQKVVLAHELAHHSQDHLPEGARLVRALRDPGRLDPHARDAAAAAGWATPRPSRSPSSSSSSSSSRRRRSRTRSRGGWRRRRTGRRSQVTRDPAALEGLMVEFSKTGLGDPDPPALAQLLFGTHPTLADRVAMARAWADARRSDPRV